MIVGTAALGVPGLTIGATMRAGQGRVLNNMVIELRKVRLTVRGQREFAFTNPREGWVYIRSEASILKPGPVHLALDSQSRGEAIIAHYGDKDAFQEAMRYLAPGKHAMGLWCDGKAKLRLTVRAVPEIAYCKFPSDPQVTEHGTYDWEFLKRHVLPHVNTIIASEDEANRPFMEEWKRRGGKWIVECPVPGLAAGSSVTEQQAYDYWSRNPGLTEPLADGLIADEFLPGQGHKYQAWSRAIKRICSSFRDKVFYLYVGGDVTRFRQFIQDTLHPHVRYAFERYLPERATQAQAKTHLNQTLKGGLKQWLQVMGRPQRNMILCLGYLEAPPESLSIDPGVDYKVYMDMQFNLVANDPAFSGLFGIMEYTSSYADEETVRWAAKLFRHYCIEGRRDMLSKQYGFRYEPRHIDNPDFDSGARSWTILSAEDGSIRVGNLAGYSWLQGRYPETKKGDNFLLTKRSQERPNKFSQEIKNLRPGQLYSLKMMTADYNDIVEGRSVKQNHAVSISLEGAEIVPEKTFRHVFPNCYSHRWGRFDDSYRAWMNYHHVVFRAKGRSAVLIVSDWLSDSEAGGPIGQELAYNFIEVQPYFQE